MRPGRPGRQRPPRVRTCTRAHTRRARVSLCGDRGTWDLTEVVAAEHGGRKFTALHVSRHVNFTNVQLNRARPLPGASSPEGPQLSEQKGCGAPAVPRARRAASQAWAQGGSRHSTRPARLPPGEGTGAPGGPGAWVVPFCAAADGTLALTWRTRASDPQRLRDRDSCTLAHEATPRECAWNPHRTPCSGNPASPSPCSWGAGVERGGGGGAGRGRGPLCGPTVGLVLLGSRPQIPLCFRRPQLLPGAWPAACSCTPFPIKHLWGTLPCSRKDFSQPSAPRHVTLPTARPRTLSRRPDPPEGAGRPPRSGLDGEAVRDVAAGKDERCATGCPRRPLGRGTCSAADDAATSVLCVVFN